jgi:3-oxoacyl-[acyl-carrier protein] reductase
MKTCIITGASSGIGRATAIELSYREYFSNIVLISRNSDELEITKSKMKKGLDVECISFDLANLSEIPKVIQDITDKFNRIDCLLNIAGYTDPQSIFSTDIENLEKTYRINLFAPILLIKECAKIMKGNLSVSKILNVASTAGISSRPGWLSYASSKAALLSVSNTLSDELSEYNIKIYSVSPGRCATELRRKLAPNEDQSKIMQPEDVANIICDLIDPNEQILDGQNIILRKKH